MHLVSRGLASKGGRGRGFKLPAGHADISSAALLAPNSISVLLSTTTYPGGPRGHSVEADPSSGIPHSSKSRRHMCITGLPGPIHLRTGVRDKSLFNNKGAATISIRAGLPVLRSRPSLSMLSCAVTQTFQHALEAHEITFVYPFRGDVKLESYGNTNITPRRRARISLSVANARRAQPCSYLSRRRRIPFVALTCTIAEPYCTRAVRNGA